jgi:ACS family D-galactonate transporter-like MFS transporter
MSDMTKLRESPQRWWLMVLLVTGMIFCYGQRGALSIAAPFMIRELQLSTAAMGVLLSAFFWSYSFMQVPAGWLVDRLGVRKSYAAGFALWSIASALTGFAGRLSSLVALRVLLGIGQASAFPASARAVSNWFRDRERGTVTGGYLTGVRLGQALVSAAGTFLLAAKGFRYFFLVVGIVPLVWLPPWWIFLRRREALETEAAGTHGQFSSGSQICFAQVLALFRHRSVIGIFLGFFAYDYVWYVYVNWLPSYLVMERGFTTREMAVYSSVPYVAMSVVVLASGFLSDMLVRYGYREIRVRKALIVAGLAAACLIVPAGLVEDKMTAVWLLSVSLSGLGIATPNTWTLTQAVCSRSLVGTVSGIQNFGGNLGGILAPVLTGLIVQLARSFALALSLTGVILILGMLSYWLLISRRVDSPDETPPQRT